MGQTVELEGMVLTAMPVRDYDKRITILTKERGKIVAFARGARRPNSQFLAATTPFSYGTFELFEGHSAYNLSKASIHNYFRGLASDIDAATEAFYFLEFAEYFCQENNDEREMLLLLYQSLRALESGRFPGKLIRVIFELRAITIEGEGPDVFSCIHCHRKDALDFFSVARGGCFCGDCREKAADAVPVSASALYAMQYIVSTPVGRLFSFVVTDEVLAELAELTERYRKHYVRHEFKTLAMMRELQNP